MRALAWILGPWVAVVGIACGGGGGGGNGGQSDAAAPVADGGAPDAPEPDAAPAVDAGPPDASPFCHPVMGTPTLAVEEVAGGFDSPVAAVVAPGSRDLYVVDKSAREIRIVREGVVLPTPFLDASGVVFPNSLSQERGLLGLAFHPDYVANGRFYIYYNAIANLAAGIGEGDDVLAEYQRSAGNPDVAVPGGTVLLSQAKFNNNHNGGWIAFGPDGKLYVALGDDAIFGSPQDRTRILGKILRLDVSQAGSYQVPPDNPFVGMGGGVREEIWIYGVRNPWRNSFDRVTGDLYIADVGGVFMEEVNVVPAGSPGGVNLGWAVMEGTGCQNGVGTCDMTGKQLPIYAYEHGGTSASITGGHVYRGCNMPDLQGTYFFADVIDGFVRSLRWDGAGGATALTDHATLGGHTVYSFGEDAEGELLLLDGSNGRLYRIVPAPP